MDQCISAAHGRQGGVSGNPHPTAGHGHQQPTKHAYPWACCLVASLISKRKRTLQDAWKHAHHNDGKLLEHGISEENRCLKEAIFHSVQALFSDRAMTFQGPTSARAQSFIHSVALDIYQERAMKGRLIALYPQQGWTNDPVQVFWHCLLGRLARLFLSLETAINAALLEILPKERLKVVQPSPRLQRFHDVVLKVMAGRMGCRPGMCKPPGVSHDHSQQQQQQQGQQQHDNRRADSPHIYSTQMQCTDTGAGWKQSIDEGTKNEGMKEEGSPSDQESMDVDEGGDSEEEEEDKQEELHEAGFCDTLPRQQISWNGVPCDDSPVSALLVIQQQLYTLVSQQLLGIPDKIKWQEAEIKLKLAEEDLKPVCESPVWLRQIARKQKIVLMTLLSFLHSLLTVARDTALVSPHFLDENELLKDARVFLCTTYRNHLLLDQIDRDEKDEAVMELKGTGTGMDWNREATGGQMPGHNSADPDLEAVEIWRAGQHSAEAIRNATQHLLASSDPSTLVWQVLKLVRLFEYCVRELDVRYSPCTHAHCKELAHKLSAVLPDPLKEQSSTGSSSSNSISFAVQRRFHFWHGRLQALQACHAAAAAAYYRAAAAGAHGGGDRITCSLEAADAFLVHAKMQQQAGDVDAAMDAARRSLMRARDGGSRKHIIQAAVLCAVLSTSKAMMPPNSKGDDASEGWLVEALKVNLLALKQLQGSLPFGVPRANAEGMVSQCRQLLDHVKGLSLKNVPSQPQALLERAERIFEDATETIEKARLPSMAQGKHVAEELKVSLQLHRRLPGNSMDASSQAVDALGISLRSGAQANAKPGAGGVTPTGAAAPIPATVIKASSHQQPCAARAPLPEAGKGPASTSHGLAAVDRVPVAATATKTAAAPAPAEANADVSSQPSCEVRKDGSNEDGEAVQGGLSPLGGAEHDCGNAGWRGALESYADPTSAINFREIDLIEGGYLRKEDQHRTNIFVCVPLKVHLGSFGEHVPFSSPIIDVTLGSFDSGGRRAFLLTRQGLVKCLASILDAIEAQKGASIASKLVVAILKSTVYSTVDWEGMGASKSSKGSAAWVAGQDQRDSLFSIRLEPPRFWSELASKQQLQLRQESNGKKQLYDALIRRKELFPDSKQDLLWQAIQETVDSAPVRKKGKEHWVIVKQGVTLRDLHRIIPALKEEVDRRASMYPPTMPRGEAAQDDAPPSVQAVGGTKRSQPEGGQGTGPSPPMKRQGYGGALFGAQQQEQPQLQTGAQQQDQAPLSKTSDSLGAASQPVLKQAHQVSHGASEQRQTHQAQQGQEEARNPNQAPSLEHAQEEQNLMKATERKLVKALHETQKGYEAQQVFMLNQELRISDLSQKLSNSYQTISLQSRALQHPAFMDPLRSPSWETSQDILRTILDDKEFTLTAGTLKQLAHEPMRAVRVCKALGLMPSGDRDLLLHHMEHVHGPSMQLYTSMSWNTWYKRVWRIVRWVAACAALSQTTVEDAAQKIDALEERRNNEKIIHYETWLAQASSKLQGFFLTAWNDSGAPVSAGNPPRMVERMEQLAMGRDVQVYGPTE